MDTYVDLSSIIDVEPRIDDILELISNDNIINEIVRNRFSSEFIFDLLQSLSDEEIALLHDEVSNYIKETIEDESSSNQ